MGASKKIFGLVNRLGNALPKGIQRKLVDFPGVLPMLQRLSSKGVTIPTPEGASLVINPLFHSSLNASGDVGEYEPAIRNAIRQLTKPGMTAYDIGANVGVFALQFAALVGAEGLVYAFEPEENNYSCLKQSIQLNAGLNIKVDTRAVGNRIGNDRFDRRGGAFSGRLLDGATLHAQTDNTIDVQTVSIDHLVEQEEYRPPDILKIDVEGNEGMVFEGMKRVLTAHAPIIICELHDHLGSARAGVVDNLKSYGYTLKDVNTLDMNTLHDGRSEDNARHVVAVKKPR